MSKYSNLTEKEEEILRQNGIDVDHVTVELRGKDFIHLLNFLTRDTIIIRKGDRKW